MSLLTIITGASAELGLAQPSSVIASSDTQVQQLLAICRKEGKELARRFDWQVLQKEATFTTLAAETQTTISTVVADFARICNDTMWDRTESKRIQGPLTSEQWQRRKASAAQAGASYYFRIRGDAILFNPVPPAGHTVAFEYMSSKWCQSSGGTAQTDWAADTDTALIDEEVIRLGVVWRFLKAKGLDYSEEFRDYQMALIDLFGSDAGKQAVDMTGEAEGLWLNVPEGSWSL